MGTPREGLIKGCHSKDCYDSRRQVDNSVPEKLDIRGRIVPVDEVDTG